MFRLYDVTEGSIRLSGTDIRDATLKELRQRVGIVTQDVQLFRASVRDNLTFFNTSIPDERILEVIYDLDLGSVVRDAARRARFAHSIRRERPIGRRSPVIGFCARLFEGPRTGHSG